MKRLRVYELYGSRFCLSARSADYHGYVVRVAARSIKQAYYLASQRIWARGPEQPTGILEECPDRGQPFKCWDGARDYSGRFHDRQGKLAIVRTMSEANSTAGVT